MILQRVIYERFEFEIKREANRVETKTPSGSDELYRQVRLEGLEAEQLYISWSERKGWPHFFLSWANHSFFTAPAEVERDQSDDPPWRPLVGKPVTVEYRDDSRQIVEVRSGDAVVYCCSFDRDRVIVMQELAAPSGWEDYLS